jgi:tetratricopeptide (TPR) repeat protein
MTSRSCVSILLLLCALRAARAQEAPPPPAAPPSAFQAHRDQARNLYRAGRYEDALEELRAAYAIKPEPKLLLNLGHVHLRLDRPQDALRYYTRYRDLRSELSPDEAAELESYMAQARARLAALRPPPPPLLSPPAPAPAPAPAPPPPPAPLHRRPWLWAAVGAAAAVSATAVTLGVLLPRAGQPDLSGVEIHDVDLTPAPLALRF